jgi:hypothetical protein
MCFCKKFRDERVFLRFAIVAKKKIRIFVVAFLRLFYEGLKLNL